MACDSACPVTAVQSFVIKRLTGGASYKCAAYLGTKQVLGQRVPAVALETTAFDGPLRGFDGSTDDNF